MSKHKAIVTPERFASGLTFRQYVASITTNQEQFQREYDSFSLSPDDAAFFARLPETRGGAVHVLALGEDWCPDVVANLPIVARIAECSPQIQLRVFPRDANLDIMGLYLNQGQYQSIPTIVWYDARFEELGVWVERPAAVTALRDRLQVEIDKLGLSPEEARRERRRRLEQQSEVDLRAETVREIRALVG